MKLRKVRNFIVWIAVIIYLIVVLAFVAKKRKSTVCQQVHITISDSSTNFLLNKKNLIKYINKEYKTLKGAIVDSIDIAKLEKTVLNYPPVKTAKLYKNISGEVFIRISQRKPIMRIISKSGKSFYIDKEGIVMPFSHTYTAHVLVANGAIKSNFNLKHKISVDSISEKNKLIKDLFLIGKHINENKFLEAQINQIFVTEKEEFELVPRVGQHIVLLGTAKDYESKFKKLEVFYKEVLPRKNWNAYKKIDLRFKNQIVCKKK